MSGEQLPAPPQPPERERSLALPRVLRRATILAGRELEQPGGTQHERLGVYAEAVREEAPVPAQEAGTSSSTCVSSALNPLSAAWGMLLT